MKCEEKKHVVSSSQLLSLFRHHLHFSLFLFVMKFAWTFIQHWLSGAVGQFKQINIKLFNCFWQHNYVYKRYIFFAIQLANWMWQWPCYFYHPMLVIDTKMLKMFYSTTLSSMLVLLKIGEIIYKKNICVIYTFMTTNRGYLCYIHFLGVV